MKAINKQIYNEDSWKLPRGVWIDIPSEGKKGDRAQFRVINDIGLYFRPKGKEIEGLAIRGLSNQVIDMEIGAEGSMQILLATSPLTPTPRIGIILTLISLKPKRKIKLSPSVYKVEEVKTPVTDDNTSNKEIILDDSTADKEVESKDSSESVEDDLEAEINEEEAMNDSDQEYIEELKGPEETPEDEGVEKKEDPKKAKKEAKEKKESKEKQKNKLEDKNKK